MAASDRIGAHGEAEIDRAADAHVRSVNALLAGADSEALNVGIGRGWSVRELVASVRKVTGRSIRFILVRAGQAIHRFLSPTPRLQNSGSAGHRASPTSTSRSRMLGLGAKAPARHGSGCKAYALLIDDAKHTTRGSAVRFFEVRDGALQPFLERDRWRRLQRALSEGNVGLTLPGIVGRQRLEDDSAARFGE